MDRFTSSHSFVLLCVLSAILPSRSLASISALASSDGCHLLFRIRRTASGLIRNWAASTGVVNCSGLCEWRARKPSIASRESFLGGSQPPGNLDFIASRCLAILSGVTALCGFLRGGSGLVFGGVLCFSNELSLAFTSLASELCRLIERIDNLEFMGEESSPVIPVRILPIHSDFGRVVLH